MYLSTMELRGPSAPSALGPCDLSPHNSYLKHAAVGPNHIPDTENKQNRESEESRRWSFAAALPPTTGPPVEA